MISDQQILSHIQRQPKQTAGYTQLMREMRIKGHERRELETRLRALVRRGDLHEVGRDRYMIPGSKPGRGAERMTERAQDRNLVAGRLSMHRDGFGFVTPESETIREQTDGDIFIAPVGAAGTMVYWSTRGSTNGTPSAADTLLSGFDVGDESVVTVLTPDKATQRVKDLSGNAIPSTQRCIGCHTSTPDGLYIAYNDFFPNWSVSVGLSLPLFTGGRIRGDVLVAQANQVEAEQRLQQAREFASLDAQLALAQLQQASVAYAASAGTSEQAARAYQIAEVRYREGISTQVELNDSRLLLQQSQANRAQAARDLQVARVRLSLLRDLPLQGGAAAGQATGGTGAGQQQQQGSSAQSGQQSGASSAQGAGAGQTQGQFGSTNP